MNTNDVERRLEALAAESANPDMPRAVLDRMAQLEAGASTASRSGANLVRLPGLRVGGSPRFRLLTLLGVAAILALVGGVISISGSRPLQPTPAPAPLGSLGPSRLVQYIQSTPAPTPRASLGPWRQVHDFGSEWTFGHIWGGGPYAGVSLSWQNGEIVGLATRYNGDQQQSCVLQSKDGTDWTCAELPTPTGEACGPGPCPEVTGLAVRNGRWVVVGYSSFKSPALGMGPLDQMTLLTWTSDDGINWSVQPHTPSPSVFIPANNVVGAPTPPVLVATGSGFLMSACQNTDQPGLRTSADGTNWQPVSFAPGSMTMTCAHLGASSPAGYMASGTCWNGESASIECVAFSSDGRTWTTSEPMASIPSSLAGHLRIAPPDGPSYVDGQWVVTLDDSNGHIGYYYEASSRDGIHWTSSQAALSPDFLSTEPGLNESDYHPPVFSQQAPAGYWGLNDGPRAFYNPAMPSPGPSLVPAGAKIYWSATGMQWQPVSDAPPGWPVDVVETPASLVVFMEVIPGPPSNPVVSVWVAEKK